MYEIRMHELKQFAKNPAAYKYFQENPKKVNVNEVDEITKMAILEPEKFSKIKIIDDIQKISEIDSERPKLTKEYRNWVESCRKTYGQIMLKSDALRPVTSRDNAWANSNFAKLMDGAETGQSIHFEGNGVRVHCRYDAINHSKKIALILKFVSSSDPDAIYYEVKNRKLQLEAAALNLALGESYNIIILFVEKSEPYGVSMGFFNTSTIFQEIERINELTARFNECVTNDEWPSFNEEVFSINLNNK
jgi:hypothetical protein